MRYVVAGLALVLLAACTPTVNTGATSPASGKDSAPASSAAKTEQPTWGKRYTWSDGLAIEVAAPVACKPGEFAQPENVKRAVKFTITVVNGTNKPFDTTTLTFAGDAQFAGTKAESIYDSDGGCKGVGLDTATVLPGKTYQYAASYSVPAEKGEMQLTFQPEFDHDKAVFVGQA